jgi:hypothetical protein
MPDSSKIVSSTNSPLGSQHWFNTLMACQKAIAEILEESDPNQRDVKAMAKTLHKTCCELIEGWNALQKQLEELKQKGHSDLAVS